MEITLEVSARRPKRLVDLLILSTASLAALIGAASIGFASREPGRGVAVVFAPWTSAEQSMTQAVEAGARFVRFGGVPFVAVTMPDDAGYSARVRGAGAWFVADPDGLFACLTALSEPARKS
jgi:hypothetical protein